MNWDEFIKSLSGNEPPAELSTPLMALWTDRKGEWDHAHRLAQSVNTPDGAWVHAYLHRREGDNSNAAYWYDRAGKEMSEQSLDDEWESIVKELLR